MNGKICFNCKKRHINTKSNHKNGKYCDACRLSLKKKPKGTLTKLQIEQARLLAGTMPRDWIAVALNVSVSNLKRSCPDIKFAYHNKFQKDPNLAKEVCLYYSRFGKKKTQEKFPDIKIDSVIENKKYKSKWVTPRQVKWTGLQLIELVKMRGFLTFSQQAKYFNRPNANAGSIRSAWHKTLKISSKSKVGFHCVSKHQIQRFLKPSCKPFPIYMKNVKTAYLWHDVNKHLKPNAPDILKQSTKALAEWQEWLFDSKNPRTVILKLIKERS